MVDVGGDAAVHGRLVFDPAVGPLTGRRVGRRVEDVDPGRRLGALRRGARVVVRDDVVAAVAVQIDHRDFVPARDLVVDHAALPLAALLRVDDDFVAVPRLDGPEEALAVLLADPDAARAEPRRLSDVARRQQLLLERHRVAGALRAVQRDAFEARDEELLTRAAVPLHRTYAVDDAGDLGRDDVAFPVFRAVPEHRRLVLVVGRREALLADERR